MCNMKKEGSIEIQDETAFYSIVNDVYHTPRLKRIVFTLADKEEGLPQKVLSKKTEIANSHVSTFLQCATEKGIVRCLNNPASRTKIYALTDRGKRVVCIIHKYDSYEQENATTHTL